MNGASTTSLDRAKELFVSLSLLQTVLLAAHHGWKLNLIMVPVLIGILLLHRVLLRDPGDARFFLGGLVVGGAVDVLATVSGLATYAHPDLLGLPLWVFLLWGLLGLVVRRAIAWIEAVAAAPGQPSELGTSDLWAESGAFVAILVAIGFAWPLQWLVAVMLAGALALRSRAAWRSGDLLLAVTGAIAGPLVEHYLTGLGLYSFASLERSAIPWWLPLFWAYGVLYLRRVVAWATENAARAGAPA